MNASWSPAGTNDLKGLTFSDSLSLTSVEINVVASGIDRLFLFLFSPNDLRQVFEGWHAEITSTLETGPT
jgi:hypothetical protein